MKYLAWLSIFSTACSTMAAVPEAPISQDAVERDIRAHMISCRYLMQELTQDNLRVLSQLDVFTDILSRIYTAGEGWVQKDVHRIVDGVAFAAEKHRFQSREDLANTPYIIHPMGVAYNLLTIGRVRDADVIIAALLHDTVEDTETSIQEIEEKFGVRVAGFVEEVTDTKGVSEAERKQMQIARAPEKTAGAAQIKLADKLYNLDELLRSPPMWSRESIDDYFRWSKDVVGHLPWVNAGLKQALDKVVEEYWKNKK